MNDTLLTNDQQALKILLDSPIYVLKEDKNADDATISITEPAINAIVYKGSFAKKLLFIVSGNEQDLSDNDWELFNKTIAALKLSLNDVAILENKVGAPIMPLKDVLVELKPNKTVVFGKLNNDQVIDNSILYCETLRNLSENKELKIEWWNSLKAFLS